jgi:hypothetical protein
MRIFPERIQGRGRAVDLIVVHPVYLFSDLCSKAAILLSGHKLPRRGFPRCEAAL